MAQPTAGDVHVNQPLTNISIAFMQDESRFIASNVFPNIPVSKRSDLYFIYNREDWNRIEAKKRAPGTESAGSGFNLETDSYFADVDAVHKDIADQIRANADSPIDMDRDATRWVTQQLMLRKEKDWATNYFTTGVWASDLSGTDSSPGANEFLQWDAADSTPIEDITNQAIAVSELTGFKPNTLVLSPYVYNTLKNHPNIVERIKYTQTGIITADIMAALFDVNNVFIAQAIENTAVEGATANHSYIFGKHALLCYSNPNPGILSPSAGYTFSWTGYLGAGQMGNRIKMFRLERIASDRVEGEMAYDMKVVASDLGVFFEDAVS